MSCLLSTKADIDLRDIGHIHVTETWVLQVNIPLMPRCLFDVVHIGVFHDAFIAISIFQSHIHLVLMNTTNNTRSVFKIINIAIEVQHHCLNTVGSPICADLQISSIRFGLRTVPYRSGLLVIRVGKHHRVAIANESRFLLNENFRAVLVSRNRVGVPITPRITQSVSVHVRLKIIHDKIVSCSKAPDIACDKGSRGSIDLINPPIISLA
ncbi:hypothetical protein ES703_74444 [subsurface metagenome]